MPLGCTESSGLRLVHRVSVHLHEPDFGSCVHRPDVADHAGVFGHRLSRGGVCCNCAPAREAQGTPAITPAPVVTNVTLAPGLLSRTRLCCVLRAESVTVPRSRHEPGLRRFSDRRAAQNCSDSPSVRLIETATGDDTTVARQEMARPLQSPSHARMKSAARYGRQGGSELDRTPLGR